MKRNHILRFSFQLDEQPTKEKVVKIYRQYQVTFKDYSSDDVNQRVFFTEKSARRFMKRLNRRKRVTWYKLNLYKDEILMENWSYHQKKIVMPVCQYASRTTKEYPLHFVCEKEECNCQYIAEIGNVRYYQSGYMYESVCPECGHYNRIAANPLINGRIEFYWDVLEQRKKVDC